MAKVIAEYNDIKAVADAIRTKKNITGDMLLEDMPSNVLSIEGGIDTSDATITPDTVFLNETGYANGQKVTGTFTIEDEVTAQENLIAQISAALEGKAAGSGGVETCTATISYGGLGDIDAELYYMDTTGTLINTIINVTDNGYALNIMKNSLLMLYLGATCSGNAEEIQSGDNTIFTCRIYGDCTIIINS